MNTGLTQEHTPMLFNRLRVSLPPLYPDKAQTGRVSAVSFILNTSHRGKGQTRHRRTRIRGPSQKSYPKHHLPLEIKEDSSLFIQTFTCRVVPLTRALYHVTKAPCISSRSHRKVFYLLGGEWGCILVIQGSRQPTCSGELFQL